MSKQCRSSTNSAAHCKNIANCTKSDFATFCVDKTPITLSIFSIIIVATYGTFFGSFEGVAFFVFVFFSIEDTIDTTYII